jgi:tetratricopeptide (TPR) repeat protein
MGIYMKSIPVKIGIILFIIMIIFRIYLYTTYPAFKNDDSPETITCAYTLGIAHPPSYPLFTMAGKIFTLILPGSPAFRMNLFSIILALLVILASYFVLRENNKILFGAADEIVILTGLPALAFSGIFWNQSIEAKGGIYILNLLLLAVIIYCALRVYQKFNSKYLYMISYILGLSMTNHWPSMIILAPVIACIYFMYKKNLNLRAWIINIIFFALGLSVYAYLPIRSGEDGVFIFMAKPDNLKSFIWTVLRLGYLSGNISGAAARTQQAVEYVKSFAADYLLLAALIPAGIFALWKSGKKLVYFYVLIFSITAAIVTFFYSAPSNALVLIDIFVLPAQYITFIFIVTGYCLIYNKMKGRAGKITAVAAFVLLMIFSAYTHFNKNNSRNNYLAYDFGGNIIKTLEPRSFYIGELDSCCIPVIYFKNVLRVAPDVENLNIGTIQNEWGINDFVKRYGGINLRGNFAMENITGIINHFIGNRPVYFSHYARIPDKWAGKYCAKIKGILYKISEKDVFIPPGIFEIYSYRGIYDSNSKYDADLFSVYGERMAMKADELYQTGYYKESIKMYNKALLFYEKNGNNTFVSRADIYYNLSVDYAYIPDIKDQLKSLLMAAESRPNYWQAYEEAGMIYLKNRDQISAADMFKKALYSGSPDRDELNRFIYGINN